MFSYGCQQILISPDSNLKAILEFICEESNKLANCGIYYSRQLYFKTGRIAHKYELHKILGNNPNGAANIIRKVAATLGINLGGVSSGALKTPLRVPLWTVQESPADANQSACGLEA